MKLSFEVNFIKNRLLIPYEFDNDLINSKK